MNGPKFTPEQIEEIARREALDNCPVKAGMIVVRKNQPDVRGEVLRVFLYGRPDIVKGRYVWRPRCRVAWEGSEWNLTTNTLADNLEVA